MCEDKPIMVYRMRPSRILLWSFLKVGFSAERRKV